MTPTPSPWPVTDFPGFMALLFVAGVLFMDLFAVARGFFRAWREGGAE